MGMWVETIFGRPHEEANPSLGPRDHAQTLRAEAAAHPSIDALYDAHFDLVWRTVRRLGVGEASIDDAVQDVFLTAHRRLPEFEGRSSTKTWLVGITLRVAKDHRRRRARKEGHEPLPVELVDRSRPSPAEAAERSEALLVLDRILGTLDADKRAVFVMAELEEMSAPEMADALATNLNTIYSRLRAARKAFERALARHRAEEERRTR